ncbi:MULTISPECIES: SapC family protein [unclassified Sphingomonas]|uniref:SapC family protein n=1 Tax=unclassified Sphingomonas TaxID=196159 RepID=UPI001D0FC54A|nr:MULTISPECIES: SapC family protein [unclassified Sphingomonas]MCC2980484.1 SapC family protein [Sphingomonas sp. IC4-52]MCD2316417.1 SapC family protein [Sphingomonas sp. IC-11]
MASAPQQQLPLFYNGLEPLSSELHADYKIRPAQSAPFLATQHAIPITIDEFALVQRYMPIVFSAGEDSVPIALMGLNEGVNVFVDADGKLVEDNFYVPAYIRRYPYLLARLRPDAQELSLCFDPTSDTIGQFDEGQPLFENGQPSEVTKNILAFNEQFEQAGARTAQFMNELRETELLMDGEVSIQHEGYEQPFVYRGFQMINEEKLQDLRGDQLRKMTKSGMLPLLYAHLFSLSLMREVFARQVSLGKMPQPTLSA